MQQKILVTYASRTGSTAGVAEAIGDTLQAHGALVDVLAMDAVSDLAAYDAVVAGSAIQSSKWLPEAMDFLERHQVELAGKPFAAFLVCMAAAVSNGQFQEDVVTFMEPVRALVEPVKEGYFAGTLDIDKVPSRWSRMGFRVSVAMGVWSEGDHRDWDAIHDWAEELEPLLEA